MGDSPAVVVCPWCWNRYRSQVDWGDHFAEAHPWIAALDALPFLNLNTPGRA